ncbi:methyltransferase domain-containing protein [Pseudazoarcus pumilus]|uniref:Small RNA 2'-O-methyltransferase n=1 Tax=Pseudazoarcus pumilus TaxID=2067960 RepID=A0A2I6S2L6_9RHOO|nr:methyltransferase domain-containing protein [Pseudazoarcus pumilus]AUN93509.1 methyltransferase type 12 [Pseudazoarcus pumilus]
MDADLQTERLDRVFDFLIARGARSVLDLGCGNGDLLLRLARDPQIERIVGIDIDERALVDARRRLGLNPDEVDARVRVMNASFEVDDAAMVGFDAAVLLETIEHIEPSRLSRVESAVFGGYRPATVIVTTPNQEYNVLYGLLPGDMRHPGHFFEWNRAKFRRWAAGVAGRNGYDVYFDEVGDYDPARGAPTQMARFIRIGGV